MSKVQELDSIRDRARRSLRVAGASLEMPLFHFLLELIHFKDAEELLLRVPSVEIRDLGDGYSLQAEAYGERIDAKRHQLLVDVKAVSRHRASFLGPPEADKDIRAPCIRMFLSNLYTRTFSAPCSDAGNLTVT